MRAAAVLLAAGAGAQGRAASAPSTRPPRDPPAQLLLRPAAAPAWTIQSDANAQAFLDAGCTVVGGTAGHSEPLPAHGDHGLKL